MLSVFFWFKGISNLAFSNIIKELKKISSFGRGKILIFLDIDQHLFLLIFFLYMYV